MSKPIGVFFTDPHFSEETIEINSKIWAQADELATKLDVDLFSAGDGFTSRKSQSLYVLSSFQETIESLNSKLWMIPGNHDKVDQSIDLSYLDLFKYHPNVSVVDHPRTAQTIGDTIIFFLPYYTNDIYVDRLKALVKAVSADKYKRFKKVLVTHQSISGVKNNDYNVVVNELEQDLFLVFDLVLVGHYHDRSEIGSNILYLGSSYQANFGEDENKGFLVLYDDLTYKFIKTEFPRYITEGISLTQHNPKYISDLHKKYANSEDHVRFIFFGTEEETKSIDKTIYEKDGIKVIIDNDKVNIKDLSPNSNNLNTHSFRRFTKSDIIDKEFKEFCGKENFKEDEGIGFLELHLSEKTK